MLSSEWKISSRKTISEYSIVEAIDLIDNNQYSSKFDEGVGLSPDDKIDLIADHTRSDPSHKVVVQADDDQASMSWCILIELFYCLFCLGLFYETLIDWLIMPDFVQILQQELLKNNSFLKVSH